ncbi:putative MFS transporter [Tothia fuscella]|uniref:MFS transporter n=1 Tax=Tothia fuscella TaxID=1048955 RepID=A0A9P4P231_9PEZI|nr:putative MFS transporter [Tothia fuscella]
MVSDPEKELGSRSIEQPFEENSERQPGPAIPSDSIAAVDHTVTSLQIANENDTAGPSAHPSTTASITKSKFKTATIVAALYLTLFIAALDQMIVATAIPTITHELHSARGYTWIGGAYLIANAAGGPIWAKLSDIWGRKPILLAAVSWFLFASIICARAGSMRVLIGGRALQGASAGGCLQLVTITISDMFSLRSRSLYLGGLGFMWAIAGGIGPVLGGALAQYASWRWIFWINLPTFGITFVVLSVFLDVHNPRTNVIAGIKAIDWLGSLSILAVVIMLLLGLNFGGETFPWSSPKVICLLIFGFLATFIFLFTERKIARYPLMPAALFRNKSNIATLIVTACHGCVYIGSEYYLPLYFQSTHAATPTQSGLLILPTMLMSAVMGIVCGIVMHRYSAYRGLIIVGSVLMTVGTGLYIMFDAETSIAMIIGLQFIAGTGAGLLFEPVYIAIQAFTGQENVATASSTLSFTRNMATSLGVVIGGVVFQNSMTSQSGCLAATGLPPAILSKLSGQDAAANVDIVAMIADVQARLVVQKAFASSTRNMWIFYTCVGTICVLASFFIKASRLSEEHVETKTGLLTTEKKAGEMELQNVDGIAV